MNLAQALLVFAGIPVLVTLVVATAVFGADWVAWTRRRRRRDE